MNSVSLIGRLTKDPDVRYGAENQLAVARFSVAIDRGKDRDGQSRGTDFPNIVCFGKTAELVEKYMTKGRLVGIQGRVQTGKYEKDGRTVYTTDILADRVEFLDWGDKNEGEGTKQSFGASKPSSDVPEGFGALTDDDIPF
ncbi:MAG: single-stranded DNA-binding protein [Clostridia bacterium]|nr:single-stranded DNA-binding protein [Clostridia bacterium]